MSAYYINDRYLSSEENGFVDLITADLDAFVSDNMPEFSNRVMIFPPVPNRLRFIIHRTVEQYSNLCSFSIGIGEQRRTVVCLQETVMRNVLEEGILSGELNGDVVNKSECKSSIEATAIPEATKSHPEKCHHRKEKKVKSEAYIPPARRSDSSQTDEKNRSSETSKRLNRKSMHSADASSLSSAIVHSAKELVQSGMTDRHNEAPKSDLVCSGSNLPSQNGNGVDDVATDERVKRLRIDVLNSLMSSDAVLVPDVLVDRVALTDVVTLETSHGAEANEIADCNDRVSSVNLVKSSCSSMRALDIDTNNGVNCVGFGDKCYVEVCNAVVGHMDPDASASSSDISKAYFTDPATDSVSRSRSTDENVVDRIDHSTKAGNDDCGSVAEASVCSSSVFNSEASSEERVGVLFKNCTVGTSGCQDEEKLDSCGRLREYVDADCRELKVDSEAGTEFAAGCKLGEELDAELMKELTTAVGEVTIVRPKSDYTSHVLRDLDLSDNVYGHLVEIYDFPVGTITRDLLAAFRIFHDDQFNVKWVDDTHAIGTFSSSEMAKFAVDNFNYQDAKVRPINEASAQTKYVAKHFRDLLQIQPPKPRPATNTSAARNMVMSALGMNDKVSKERKDKDRRRLREARERKHAEEDEPSRRRKEWDGKTGRCAMDME